MKQACRVSNIWKWSENCVCLYLWSRILDIAIIQVKFTKHFILIKLIYKLTKNLADKKTVLENFHYTLKKLNF